MSLRDLDMFLEGVESDGVELYHATNYNAATNIIKHNYFRPSKGLNLKGLSTTKDPNYNWGSVEVKFVLSRSELERDYDLVDEDEDLTYVDGSHLNESEVVVLSDKAIMNADKYIIKVLYKESDGNWYEEFLSELSISRLKSEII
jgi:hypothetical protein